MASSRRRSYEAFKLQRARLREILWMLTCAACCLCIVFITAITAAAVVMMADSLVGATGMMVVEVVEDLGVAMTEEAEGEDSDAADAYDVFLKNVIEDGWGPIYISSNPDAIYCDNIHSTMILASLCACGLPTNFPFIVDFCAIPVYRSQYRRRSSAARCSCT